MSEFSRLVRVNHLASSLKYRSYNSFLDTGMIASVDALIARAKLRQPDLSDEEINYIHEVIGEV